MRSIEIIQSEKHTEERLREKWTGTCDIIPKYLAFYDMEVSEDEKQSAGGKKSWMMVENLPNLAKTINLQIETNKQTKNWANPKAETNKWGNVHPNTQIYS